MKVKIFFILLAILAARAVATASDDIFVLKDGTRLEGYIMSQEPGGDSYIFSRKSIFVIPSEKIKLIKPSDINVKDLSSEWQSWAKENPGCVMSRGQKRYLTLCSVDVVIRYEEPADSAAAAPEYADSAATSIEATALYNDADSAFVEEEIQHYDNVRILEEGDVVKILDLSERRNILVKSSDLHKIIYGEQPSGLLSGLIYELELKDQSRPRVIGNLTENTPGHGIKIMTGNGVVKSYAISDISALYRLRKNDGQSYLEQSPYLDIAYTKDGKKVSGVLIEQRYGSATRSSSIVIVNGKGERIKLLNSNIVRLAKEVNPHYNPVKELKMAEGVFYANQSPLKPTRFEQTGKDITVYADSTNTISTKDMKGVLQIDAKAQTADKVLYLLRLSEKNKKGYYSVPMSSILASSIQIREKTFDKGKLKWTFTVSAGNYLVYLPNDNKAFICEIK